MNNKKNKTMNEEKQTGEIFKQIPAIIGAIAPVSKDKKNQQQGYKFRGIDDIYTALNKLLAHSSVCIIPFVKSKTESEVTTKSGGKGYRVCLEVEYHLYAKDGSSIVSCVSGEAIDYGDKATPKALSMAYKYMAFQVFCIPIEEAMDTEFATHDLVAVVPVDQSTIPWEQVVCHIGTKAKGKRLGEMPREVLENLITQWEPPKGPNGTTFPADANLRFALDEAAVKLNITSQ